MGVDRSGTVVILPVWFLVQLGFFFIPLLSQKTGAVTPNCVTSLQAKTQMVENGQVKFAFNPPALLKECEVERQARAVGPFQTFSCCVLRRQRPRSGGACGGGLPVAAAD